MLKQFLGKGFCGCMTPLASGTAQAGCSFMTDTIAKLLADFPPNVVRMLARSGNGKAARRLTHEEVVKSSGLTYARVRTISGLTSWRGVTIEEADAFMGACGVTLANLWRHRAYLRRSLNPRITKSPLHYTLRLGVPTRPPAPSALVAAAVGGRRKRSVLSGSS